MLALAVMGGLSSGAQAQNSDSQESRILPLASQWRFFERTWFGLGMYSEHPVMRTQQNYQRDRLGITLTFDQMVHESWSGGLWLHWGQWRGDATKISEAEAKRRAGNKDAEGPAPVISPLTIVSNVSYYLPMGRWHPPTGRYLRPFLGAGIGWLQFLNQLALKVSKSKDESSEPILLLNAGMNFVFSESFGVRLVLERWRGVRTYNFVANRLTMQLLMGDFGEASGLQ